MLFSSKSSEWETPDDLFAMLDKEWNFTLDPASTHENRKCEKYFTKEENGLIQSWAGERVFCNPPYGRELPKWLKKCADESVHADIVLLIPSRTDTKAIHEYCFNVAKAICFVKGRIKFNNRLLPSYREDGQHKVSSAPFPSLIAVYSKEITEGQYALLSSLGFTVVN